MGYNGASCYSKLNSRDGETCSHFHLGVDRLNRRRPCHGNWIEDPSFEDLVGWNHPNPNEYDRLEFL